MPALGRIGVDPAPGTVLAVPEPTFQAALERDADTLVVTWTGDEPVAVHVSRSPVDPAADGPDPSEAGARGGRLVLAGLDPATRYYVHLVRPGADTVVVAERLVALEGTLNFRDLGGYVGDGGRRVRWGRVFRSDHLANLTAEDVGRLEAIGVRTVIDYQGAHERVGEAPSALPEATVRRLERPIVDGPADGITFYDRVMDRSITRFETADLTEFYLRTLERSAAIFGEVLGLIADPDHHAVVFHCRAGKDRTGLTAALLLGALGVADADILDDYVLTNRYRSGRRMEILRPELASKGIDIEAFEPLFIAPRETMAATLAGLHERYGSVADYLRSAAGLDDAVLADLRHALLEPPARSVPG
jgi:protein-tyrosine phosphatase